ncbi:MAG TPA: hypothetical protein VGF48_12785 [Thermoanaerobaculia bacterium]|jgi:hypothetical protein
MPKNEKESKGRSGAGKKKGSSGSSTLRNVVASAASTDALIDLVERLGLVDMVMGRIKSRLEETNIDELFEEITDYMKRNPEVLVATMASVTLATGLVVWLNSRREWDGTERRRVTASSRYTAADDDDDDDDEEFTAPPVKTTTTAPGRVRKTA